MANLTKAAARRARAVRVKRSEIDRLTQLTERLIEENLALVAAAEKDAETIRLLQTQVNQGVLAVQP